MYIALFYKNAPILKVYWKYRIKRGENKNLFLEKKEEKDTQLLVGFLYFPALLFFTA